MRSARITVNKFLIDHIMRCLRIYPQDSIVPFTLEQPGMCYWYANSYCSRYADKIWGENNWRERRITSRGQRFRGWKQNLDSWITAKKSEKKRRNHESHHLAGCESWIMDKKKKESWRNSIPWVMSHWSKNIRESRIIILKRFRFHPRKDFNY